MDNKLKNILHVTHSWGGGIPVYISDLQYILSEQYNLFTLKSSLGKVVIGYPECDEEAMCYSLSSRIGLLEISNDSYKNVIKLILQAYDIDLVHVNITLSHSFDIFHAARELNIPVVYTVHDYFYICPTFHLVDKNGKFCHLCEYGQEDEECLRGHPYINYTKFNKASLYKWRSEFLKVKDIICQYVFPSNSCRELFSSFYDIKPKLCRVIAHGISLRHEEGEVAASNKELRVGILGTMLKHKGELLYKHILKNSDSKRFKFYHFGDGTLVNDKLINIGSYNRSSIYELLRGNNIDVVLLLSTWPETFSYTLSETFIAGIPPIVTNLGALAERVEKNGAGWIVDFESPEEICSLLEQLESDRALIDEKREILCSTPLDSLEKMKAEYGNLYIDMIANCTAKGFDDRAKSSALCDLDSVRTVCDKDIIENSGLSALELFERSINGKVTNTHG